MQRDTTFGTQYVDRYIPRRPSHTAATSHQVGREKMRKQRGEAQPHNNNVHTATKHREMEGRMPQRTPKAAASTHPGTRAGKSGQAGRHKATNNRHARWSRREGRKLKRRPKQQPAPTPAQELVKAARQAGTKQHTKASKQEQRATSSQGGAEGTRRDALLCFALGIYRDCVT